MSWFLILHLHRIFTHMQLSEFSEFLLDEWIPHELRDPFLSALSSYRRRLLYDGHI